MTNEAKKYLVAFGVFSIIGAGCGPADGPSLIGGGSGSLDPNGSGPVGPGDSPVDRNDPNDPLENPDDGTQGTQEQGEPGQSERAADEHAWVTITWDSAPKDSAVNLDLHVIDPTGSHIYYLNTGGSEEVEGTFASHPECISYDCHGDEQEPRESIYWELDGMLPGQYQAWVTNASDRQGSFEIEIVSGDHRVNESATVGAGGETSKWTWEYDGPTQDDPDAPCLRQLDQHGIPYRSISLSNGQCVVEDAVEIEGPINGITYRHETNRSDTTFETACRTALALHRLADVLKSHQIDTAYHIGSYACRNTRGGGSLSQHAFALAIDLAGFATTTGKEYSLVRDWEHDTNSPQTEAGQVLHDIAQQAHDQRIFNVILTPDFNSDHDNHFHMDLTEGAHSLRSTSSNRGYKLSDEWGDACEHHSTR